MAIALPPHVCRPRQHRNMRPPMRALLPHQATNYPWLKVPKTFCLLIISPSFSIAAAWAWSFSTISFVSLLFLGWPCDEGCASRVLGDDAAVPFPSKWVPPRRCRRHRRRRRLGLVVVVVVVVRQGFMLTTKCRSHSVRLLATRT